MHQCLLHAVVYACKLTCAEIAGFFFFNRSPVGHEIKTHPIVLSFSTGSGLQDQGLYCKVPTVMMH